MKAKIWFSLPRASRQEAWRLASDNDAHPDPAIQASASGWYRVLSRAQGFALILLLRDPTYLLPGQTVFHIGETGVRIPRWRLDIPWEQIEAVNVAWRMGTRTRVLGLAFQLRDLETVWRTSGLPPTRQRMLKGILRRDGNWGFVPAWAMRGRIDGPLGAAIHHHQASRDALRLEDSPHPA